VGAKLLGPFFMGGTGWRLTINYSGFKKNLFATAHTVGWEQDFWTTALGVGLISNKPLPPLKGAYYVCVAKTKGDSKIWEMGGSGCLRWDVFGM
jgi:hypothetical protein